MWTLPLNGKNLRNLVWLKDTVRDTAIGRSNVERQNEFRMLGGWFGVLHGCSSEEMTGTQIVYKVRGAVGR